MGCILSSPDEKVCPDCDGEGGVHSDNLFSDLCKKCEGTGTILKDDNWEKNNIICNSILIIV